MGFQTTGAASELFAVDSSKVLRLPKSMSLEQGAMVEPLAVAVHAIERVGGAAGKKVLVLGAGPIGNLVAQAARGLGAAAVMITDTSEYRLELAARCGIPLRVNPLKVDLAEAVREKFGPDKADLIFEGDTSELQSRPDVACRLLGANNTVGGDSLLHRLLHAAALEGEGGLGRPGF